MRILIISPYWPWPLNSGGSVAQFGWIDYLRHRHELSLLIPADNEADSPVERLRQIWPNVRILPIAKPWQRRSSGFAKKVKDRLKDFIRSRGYVRPEEWFPPHESARLATLPGYLVWAAADEARRGYDLIQVEYTDMLSLIYALPKDVPTLFAHIEIHYTIRDRERTESSRADAYHNYIAAREKAVELDALRHYDSIATMSEYDRRVLQSELPNCDIHASPFAYVNSPDQNAEFKISAFENRIIYIGGSQHRPNIDAVQWFLDTMWPALSARFPELKFYVVGEWTPEAKQSLGAAPGVVFTGFVENAVPLLQGSMMIVPLRIGSGIRTKILMAMTLGVPMITTSVGVEGIDATNEEEILCADSPRLIQNPLTAEQMARNAFAYVQSRFSPEATGARRDAIYQLVVARHAAKRSNASSPVVEHHLDSDSGGAL